MNYFFKLFLTFNSISPLILIYFIKKNYDFVGFVLNKFNIVYNYSIFISAFLYLVVIIFFTWVGLFFIQFLSKDTNNSEYKAIELANDSFLPSYLGYFFIALSIDEPNTFVCVYLIIFIFTYFSHIHYFNPLYMLLGYKFYYMKNSHNTKIFVITKKNIREPEEMKNIDLQRISDFTFIDIGNEK